MDKRQKILIVDDAEFNWILYVIIGMLLSI